MTNKKKRIATLVAAILAIVLTIPAVAAEAPVIRVSSYKGSTLEVGERSGLIIGPSGTDYTVTSGNPDTVAVEQVLSFWVAVAEAEQKLQFVFSPQFLNYLRFLRWRRSFSKTKACKFFR